MVTFGEDWNSRQLRKALIEEYPYLQPRSMVTGRIHPDYDYQYIVGECDLPTGWLQLFFQLCEDIRGPLEKVGDLDKFRFTQVKEKFGQMRLYTNGATREVLNILDKYEFLSQQVCSVCGKPATVMTSGWICPYCSEHVRGTMENVDDSELIEIKTSYIRKTWTPDGAKEETIIDCADEWNRYLKRIGYDGDR